MQPRSYPADEQHTRLLRSDSSTDQQKPNRSVDDGHLPSSRATATTGCMTHRLMCSHASGIRCTERWVANSGACDICSTCTDIRPCAATDDELDDGRRVEQGATYRTRSDPLHSTCWTGYSRIAPHSPFEASYF
ncbi:hypothetical protein OE88DRAFT_1084379 [Heliocybe sulcata]|uniref:Uncharacterized protein n=1 Tax=Heliocybe sulcata TaxID=5364 RepID=A0A5C3MLR7_9AGAM|nr:hypothetical protein OE88DRAFT_1084379 [Heliocybe sulcata]